MWTLPQTSSSHMCQCHSSSWKKRKRPYAKLLVPVIIGTSSLNLLALFFIICLRRKKMRNNASSAQSSNEQFILRISFAELHKAIEGISESNKIDVGSYDSMYKGNLDQDGIVMAIKVFNLPRRGASKNFMSECKALRKIRHRNLVKVLSACSSLDFQGNDFNALVFEFMSKGNLDEWLHPKVIEDEHQRPTLLQRLNTAIDVAFALKYLHTQCEVIVVHNDLKPNNIHLDDGMTGHINDFGISKINSVICSTTIATNTGTDKNSTSMVKGFIGYIAPEYGINSHVLTEGDMYSYGIILLEMFTGRRPADSEF